MLCTFRCFTPTATPESVSSPRDSIITLGTVGSSKIDHRYPLSVGEGWSAVQSLPAVLLSDGSGDGERERRGTLRETAVITEFS